MATIIVYNVYLLLLIDQFTSWYIYNHVLADQHVFFYLFLHVPHVVSTCSILQSLY